MRRTAVPVGRRRALSILAAGAAAWLTGSRFRGIPPLFEWNGSALGTTARISLYGADREVAMAAVAECAAEIERLENEFSLFRSDSSVSRLNRHGTLMEPSHDVIRLLSASRHFSEASGGAFDVTVQPLWQLYAAHFASHPDDRMGPSADAIAAARSRIDYRRISISESGVALAPGTALTLNGIAQGYITDRVADLLRARGWADVLVDVGELRGLGGHPDGRPWSIALRDPRRMESVLARIPLADRSLAVSAGSGTPFEPSRRHHHLFDPKGGSSANIYSSVAVLAPTATIADAVSTAIFVAPPEAARTVLEEAGATGAWLIGMDGSLQHLRARNAVS